MSKEGSQKRGNLNAEKAKQRTNSPQRMLQTVNG